MISALENNNMIGLFDGADQYKLPGFAVIARRLKPRHPLKTL
jgi:hypothetical protein